MDSTKDSKAFRNNFEDRRANTRHDSRQLGKVLARVLGRCDAKLIDISRRGVLFDSEARLMVGTKTTIRITTTDTSVAMKGTVVRSRVAMLGKTVIYETALELDEDLTLVDMIPDALPMPTSTLLMVDDLGNVHAADGDVLSGEQVEFVTIVPHDFHELQRRASTHDIVA
jgi:hypothetical protein